MSQHSEAEHKHVCFGNTDHVKKKRHDSRVEVGSDKSRRRYPAEVFIR